MTESASSDDARATTPASGPVAGPPVAGAAVSPRRGQHPVGGAPGDVGRLGRRVLGRAAEPDPVDVHPQQLGVVVEHFLEMRNGPVAGHRIPGEAAVELVEQRRAGHGREGPAGHVRAAAASTAVPGCVSRAASRRRPAVRRRAGSGIPARPTAGTSARRRSRRRPRPRSWPASGNGFAKQRRRRAVRAERRGARAAASWDAADAARQGARRSASTAPRRSAQASLHGLKHLPEGRTARHRPGREVGAGMEGPAVGQAGRRTSASLPRR